MRGFFIVIPCYFITSWIYFFLHIVFLLNPAKILVSLMIFRLIAWVKIIIILKIRGRKGGRQNSKFSTLIFARDLLLEQTEDPLSPLGHLLQASSFAEPVIVVLLQSAAVNRESVETNLVQFSSLLFSNLGELECFAIWKKVVAVEERSPTR